MVKRILLCIFALLFSIVPVFAADARQASLARIWQAVQPKPEDQPVYLSEPLSAAPYAIGDLTPQYRESGLRYLNFLRQLAGLAPVTLSEHLCVQAQYGAVLLAANDSLSHTPEKPFDMEDSFYRMGASACKAANLSMRYNYSHSGLLQNALQGQMNDFSASNRQTLGHRRWLLDPALGQTGFGVASSASDRLYVVVPVFDNSGSGTVPETVCWPAAGQFPNALFAPGTPWSISLDPGRYRTPREERLQVVITRLRDGRQFVPSLLDGQLQLNEEGSYLLVSTEPYGTGSCITFSIGKSELGENRYLGDYTVSVSGLQYRDGSEASLTYTVRFFDIHALSRPSDWAQEEVQQATELSLLPESLTDLWQQPMTRLEYCRLVMQALRVKTGQDNPDLVLQYAIPEAPIFTDCADPDVLTAAAIGAVKGLGDGTFRPGRTITRQDAAVMLKQAAEAVSTPFSAEGALPYLDTADIADYACEAVLWASRSVDLQSGKPVMQGVGQGRFDPLGQYTREQAALTILRLFRAEAPTADINPILP